jgi:hypothetical protein
MEDVGMAIWSILWLFGIHFLWPFGTGYGYLVYFSCFGVL